ncbi:hypothetical protein DOP62_14115 (plasmid) [Synechococcus elongatus PCC 11801]|uniref:Uncharacterized protein n=2 Tax=Synechococcus elongatus TaxID=32046 RepID=A0ACD5A2Z6_SYNEL
MESINLPGGDAEQWLWNEVQRIFSNRECRGYWRFPFFSRILDKRHREPDILIADRELGLIFIEVRRISIRSIASVYGSSWRYSNGYRVSGSPYQEAIESVCALFEKYNSENNFTKTSLIPFRSLVALPLVTENEWKDAGFSRTTDPHSILFKSHLEENLLSLIHESQLLGSNRRLTDDEWWQLLRLVGEENFSYDPIQLDRASNSNLLSTAMSFQSAYPQILLPELGAQRFVLEESREFQQVVASYEEKIETFKKISGVKRSIGTTLGTGLLLGLAAIELPILLGGMAVAGVISSVAWIRQSTETKVEKIPVYKNETIVIPEKPFEPDHFQKGTAPGGRFDDLFCGSVASELTGIRFCAEGIAISSVSRLNYFPDILIYTDTNFLIDIEIDEPWYFSKDEGCRKLSHDPDRDAIRNQAFLREGIVVIRFTEKQVVSQTQACIQLIQVVVNSLNQLSEEPSGFYKNLHWTGTSEPLYTDPRRISAPRPDRSQYSLF